MADRPTRRGRNDASLYSGITTSAAAKAQEQREESSKEKSHQRAVLTATEEIISRLFAQELELISRLDLMNIEAIVDNPQLKVELLARKRTAQHLRRIQKRLSNILREPKKIIETPEVGFGITEE